MLRVDISSRRPGSKIQLAVLRESDGAFEKKTFAATLRELRGEQDEEAATVGVLDDSDNALRGIAVKDLSELSPGQRRQMGIGALAEGVVVTEVDASSPAARAGIRPRDVITSLNKQPVTGASDFRAMAKNLGDKLVRVRIQRGNDADIVAVEP